MREDRKAKCSLFVTLTYNDENVPITRRGLKSLWKKDVQLFLKRLRKKDTKSAKVSPVKYFAVGEYGGRTRRPHYHLILFNRGEKAINAAWRLGDTFCGTVGPESIYYVLKYMMKPEQLKARSKGKGDPRKSHTVRPEFRIMSKGLGLDYVFNEKFQKWHQADLLERMYLNLSDGKKIAMPRYYKDKLYTDEEREDISYKSLLDMRKKAENDGRTAKEIQDAILADWMALQFESKSRVLV